MPADPSPIARHQLPELVRGLVADVLMVAPDVLHPESLLVRDLGAESLDFLDLVFRLEDSLGKPIPVEEWGEYVRGRAAGRELASIITMQLVVEFAEQELARPTSSHD